MGKYYITILHHSHMSRCHSVTSHDNHGKIVHKLCSSYISSIEEIDKNSIKFSLST